MILLGFQCLRPDPLKSQPYSGALSVCDDYCDHLPGAWCLDWIAPREIPADFTEGDADAMIRECTPAFGIAWEWPDLMTDLAWARRFHARWAAPSGYRLMAIACAPEDRLRIVEGMRPPPQQPGFAPMGALGLWIMAERSEVIDPDWPIEGWEVLEVDPGIIGDSHGDPRHVDPQTGLMPDRQMAVDLAARLGACPAGFQHIPFAIVAVPAEQSP